MIKKSYKGILFIGDICVGGKKGLSKDSNALLAESQIEALSNLLGRADKESLLPVLAGKLIHPGFDAKLLMSVMNTVKDHSIALLPTRHIDGAENYSYMDVLKEMNNVEMLSESPLRTLVDGVDVAIYGTEEGAVIPTQVRKKNANKEDNFNFMLVRDDDQPIGVDNCDAIVNGFSAFTQETRLNKTVSLPVICVQADEVHTANPKITVWSKSRGFRELKGSLITYESKAEIIEVDSAVDIIPISKSQFVSMMEVHDEEEMISEDLIKIAGEIIEGKPLEVQNIIMDLYEVVSSEESAEFIDKSA